MADAFGRVLNDGKAIERLVQDNRSLAEKVRDVLADIVNAVKRVLNHQNLELTAEQKAEFRELEGRMGEMERLFSDALGKAEAQNGQKNTAQEGGGTKFSIKRTSQMTLAQQLKMFYDGKMASSDAFYFGVTPAVLEKAGVNTLPLAFTQADFKKSTKGKHNVPRRVLKNLNSDLETALFAFGNGDRIGILTGDIDGDGKPLLVGIQTSVQMDADKVNAIRSVYGLDNPGPWLQNQIESGKTFHLLDEKRANTFLYPYGYLASRKEGISSILRADDDLQTYGAYSASVGDGIRSAGKSVTQNGAKFKTKFSLKEDSQGRKLTGRAP